jgi:hypothetical protein
LSDEDLMNLCLYCGGDTPMDPELAKELGTCPKCGRDLSQAKPAPPAAVLSSAILN